MIVSATDTQKDLKYASILSRCVAFLIDFFLNAIVYWIVGIIVFVLILGKNPNLSELDTAVDYFWVEYGINVLTFLGYFCLCEGIFLPATIGKVVFRLRVVNAQGAKLDFPTSFLRSVYKLTPYVLLLFIQKIKFTTAYGAWRSHQKLTKADFYSADSVTTIIWVLLLGICIAGWRDKKKQMLHDKIAKTVVIKTDEMGLFALILRKCIQWVKFLRKAGTPN